MMSRWTLEIGLGENKTANGQLQNMPSIEVRRCPPVPINNHVRVRSRRSHRNSIAIPTQDSRLQRYLQQSMQCASSSSSHPGGRSKHVAARMDGRPCVRFNQQVLIHRELWLGREPLPPSDPVFNSQCYQCVGKDCFLLLPCTLQAIAPETPLLVCPITRYATRSLLQKQPNR